MYTCVRVCVSMYLCAYVNMYKCMYTVYVLYTDVCIYMAMHIIYTHVFMYIHHDTSIHVYVSAPIYLNNLLMCTCFSSIIDLDGFSFLNHDNHFHNHHPNPNGHHLAVFLLCTMMVYVAMWTSQLVAVS